MRLDSIKRLKYFNDIALTGSFSKSAQRLGIAQPALSIAIKKLEDETGLKLINRSDRQMVLTADGQVLLKHARSILAELEDAGRELSDLQGLKRGDIHVGASSMISTYLLPSRLIAFNRAYPGIRIRLVEAGTDTLERMVIDGELDLALLRSEHPHEQIRYTANLSEQVVACLPVDHPLAERPSLSLEAFCAQPLVMFREGYFLRESVERRARQAGLDLDVRFETNLVELLKHLVVNEVGIATCLSMIVTNECRLCTRPFDPPIPLEMAWGWKRNHYLSRASQAFLSFVGQDAEASAGGSKPAY